MAAPASDAPRVRVAALLMIDGRILLVRQRKEDAAYHLLPGGGVDARETLADALRREVLEETGLRCEVGEPILINDTIAPDGARHLVNITFRASITGGELLERPTDPTIDGLETVDPEVLTTLDLRPPIAQALLDVIEAGPGAPARYLGSVWTDE